MLSVSSETEMPRRFSSKLHIAELDGIRAIAIWLVLFDHIVDGWPTPPEALAVIPAPIRFIALHGWLGVDLFFVLSGFLITGILLDARDSPKYFRNFYARRILRILPLYYLVILVMYVAYQSGQSYFLISLVFLANLAPLFGVNSPHGPDVFWSLSVEEHFYLLWPWLVRLLSRRQLTWAALLLVIVTPILRYVGIKAGLRADNEIYLYTWFRLDGLALGALLAIWCRSTIWSARNSLILASMLVLSALLITVLGSPYGVSSPGSPLRYTQVQLCFGGFLLFVVTMRGTGWTAPLRTSFAIWSGYLSYCVYLVHLSLGELYQTLIVRWSVHPERYLSPFGVVIARGLFMIVSAFAVALLLRVTVEQPALRLKRHFQYRSADAERRQLVEKAS
jgi:peptidoglycan/LPS O-acetylase OafA/YrhL